MLATTQHVLTNARSEALGAALVPAGASLTEQPNAALHATVSRSKLTRRYLAGAATERLLRRASEEGADHDDQRGAGFCVNAHSDRRLQSHSRSRRRLLFNSLSAGAPHSPILKTCSAATQRRSRRLHTDRLARLKRSLSTVPGTPRQQNLHSALAQNSSRQSRARAVAACSIARKCRQTDHGSAAQAWRA